MTGGFGLDSSGLEQGQASGPIQRGYKPLCSIK